MKTAACKPGTEVYIMSGVGKATTRGKIIGRAGTLVLVKCGTKVHDVHCVRLRPAALEATHDAR